MAEQLLHRLQVAGCVEQPLSGGVPGLVQQDNGQGGTTTIKDKLWGAFADSKDAAIATVTGKTIPKTGSNSSAEYSITSGNLQVQ